MLYRVYSHHTTTKRDTKIIDVRDRVEESGNSPCTRRKKENHNTFNYLECRLQETLKTKIELDLYNA